MVPVTGDLLLKDAEATLYTIAGGELPPMEAALVAWLMGEEAPSSTAERINCRLRSYESVAIAAFAEAAGWGVEIETLEEGLRWLMDVALERTGIPAPVVTDGVALIALGLAARRREWLAAWYDRVLEYPGIHVHPAWAADGGLLVRGRTAANATAELRLALAARSVIQSSTQDEEHLLESLLSGTFPEDAVHANVVLAAYHWLRRAVPIALPGRASVESVADLLRTVPRALHQWTWESKSKTRGGDARQWHIDSEYHVQNLLWALFAPIFPDLKREDYTAQVGLTQPRADLAIPSLRLIIEIKFARSRRALKTTVTEIAQDASLYFIEPTAYDQLLVFIWDDAANIQDHHSVAEGLRKFDRVADAIIVSRPGHMVR